jgi:hypothetical protein
MRVEGRETKEDHCGPGLGSGGGKKGSDAACTLKAEPIDRMSV